MATVTWRGDAPDIAQVVTLTLTGTWESTDVINLTINGKTVSIVAGSTNTTTIATLIASTWEALSDTEYPEFAEVTATSNLGVVTLTADTAGVPFVLTSATTETGGGAADAQVLTQATATAASGKNFWSVAANWSVAAVPVDGDTVYIQDSEVDILYGLGQSLVDLASLNIDQSFSGTLGLPRTNAGGYIEYRDTYLAIGGTAINIGRGEGAGSGRLKIDSGSTAATTLNIYNSGTQADDSLESILWKATHADSVVNINKGFLGIGVFAGELATVATLRMGYRDSVASDAIVRVGEGVTLGVVEKSGGELRSNSAITTFTQNDGDSYQEVGGITTLKVRGGTHYYNSTGTLGTPTASGSGVIDFSRDMRAKVVTNPFEAYGSQAKVHDPFQVVASLRIDFNETQVAVNDSQLGTNWRLTRGAVA